MMDRIPYAIALAAALCMTGAARGASEPSEQKVEAPYKFAHDAPLDAAEKVDAGETDYTRYRVEFNGIRGDRVPAYLYLPKSASANAAAAKHPAVLLQYGSGGNKRTNYIVALGEQHVRAGFVVLTIGVPYRGERRKADRNWREWFDGRGGTFLQTCGDYGRAVDYLLTRTEVDAGRIGYAGISMGAITGVTYVAHDPRVKAMASIVGGGNMLGALKVDLDPEARKAAERI